MTTSTQTLFTRIRAAGRPARAVRRACATPLLLAVLAGSQLLATPSAWAAGPEGRQERREDRRDDRQDSRQDRRDDRRDDRQDRREDRRDDRQDNRQDRRHDRRDDRWYDGAHGHNHAYPPPGRIIVTPPRHAPSVWWGGVSYRYADGVWYNPGPRGWVVVRPPVGVVIRDLPALRTVLVIGGLTYLYANGVYYRERSAGDYEVVPPPPPQADAQVPDKTFVYPRNGQSAQQQASDEYECHRWAVTQSGFDPTGAATGQGGSVTVSTTARDDYQRARIACLEGRGYTVR